MSDFILAKESTKDTAETHMSLYKFISVVSLILIHWLLEMNLTNNAKEIKSAVLIFPSF
jgi:hypothetical protein